VSRTVHIPTELYPGALTTLALLCYPDDAAAASNLHDAGLAFLVRASRRGAIPAPPAEVVNASALLKQWASRDMWNCLRRGNRRFANRMAAAELFAIPPHVNVTIGGGKLEVVGEGGVNAAIRTVDSLDERNVRRSILNGSRSVMHLARAMHTTVEKWPDAERKRLYAGPLQTLLLSPGWLHRTIRTAALLALPQAWELVQKVSPALKSTRASELVRLLVDERWPKPDGILLR
jgi:hypothetical protein